MLRTVPISRTRAQLYQLIDEVRRGGRPLALTHRGEPVAVLLAHEDYERLIEVLEFVCDPETCAPIIEPDAIAL